MKAYIVSLGCPKNLTDTEEIMSKLASEGYRFTNNPSEAELILVNTCAFLQSAKKEAIDTIRELAQWKRKGKCEYLIAAGCLPQRYKHEIPKLLPEVDAFIGTPRKFESSAYRLPSTRIKATPPWFAYVKIAEGCNNRCAYCIVPAIRGPLRIRLMKDILNEVKLLAATGVKEIIYVAQDTAAYPNFPALLQKTARIKGVRWIRILYAHPAHVTDKLIEVIAKEKKIVKYLDLPIQHCHDKILKLMRRRYERPALENLIAKIRRRIPRIALRTSVIVGFPGEGEAEFEALLAFIKKVKFDRLGVFTYSQEPGTPASKMRGQVSEQKKQQRFHRLMRAQSRICRGSNKKMIGTTLATIIERSVRHGFIGRTFRDAPDIDGTVFVRSTKSLSPGELVSVRIIGARTYDLIGCLT
ncbi:MAG: 30S ribosomal protein S12 methylthiotransferase RimO [Candidatus Margulisbacteria bacterium]|nr:30S ribosomal protein S12 methylthiotransferase RimO [Candidatus Margulisiibacteriota bacterium]